MMNYSEAYRFGFQGQEQDNEIKGSGNSMNFKFRMHDPRLGRFLSIDPLTSSFPWYTPYQFAGNTPIIAIDLEGLEDIWMTDLWTNVQFQYSLIKSKLNNSVKFVISDKSLKIGAGYGGIVQTGKAKAYDKYGQTYFRYNAVQWVNPDKTDGNSVAVGGGSISIGGAIDFKSSTFQKSVHKTPTEVSMTPIAGFSISTTDDGGYYGINLGVGYEVGCSRVKVQITEAHSLTKSDESVIKSVYDKQKIKGTWRFTTIENEKGITHLGVLGNKDETIQTSIKLSKGAFEGHWKSESYIKNSEK